jgi:hypothetical protein
MGLTRPRFSQFDTTISSISDPITVLNKSSTLANVDVGFIINRNSGALANTAIFWNESANTFALAFTTNSGEVPNANIAISEYANLKINALTADTAVFSSTGAIKIPSGNTLQRTSGTTGQIRFNTSTSQFEGYQGASWSSLGGVRSVDNATYIIAEQYPGAGNNILYFYTNNTLQATVSSTGINLAGNVLATTGTFNTLTVNGNESVTGYLNVTGNIIATTATVGTVEAAGMIYANSATNSTSTTTGALRVAGGIGVVGNIWADRIHAGNNGNGTNFKVGDDLWLGDINVANTMRLMGAQDNTQAFIRFGNTNTSTLGVSGSGPLSWGGVLNVTGNILAANVNASYFIGSGTALTGINSFGNVFVVGQSPVLADNTSDTLTLVGGTGISITTDAANDSVTISTVSTSGPFATDNDFGLTTDLVTTTLDLGDLVSTDSTTFDLGGLVAAEGLIYPGQLVLPSYATASLPSASVDAQLVYDSTAGALKYTTGSAWTTVLDGTGNTIVTGNVTATGGWGGTLSSAGVLGGVPMAFFAERTSTGTAGGVMAHGNGSTTGKGLRMPYAGKLIAGTMFGANVNGTITIDAYLNGTANTSYRFSQTGALTDVGETQNWSSAPLTFAAGDTLGWYQTAVPTTANAYTVTFFVTYN